MTIRVPNETVTYFWWISGNRAAAHELQSGMRPALHAVAGTQHAGGDKGRPVPPFMNISREVDVRLHCSERRWDSHQNRMSRTVPDAVMRLLSVGDP
jgi:hypothetical protein